MALVVFGQLVHIVFRELVLDSHEGLLLEVFGEIWQAWQDENMLEAITTAVYDRIVLIVCLNNLIVGALRIGPVVKCDEALARALLSWTFGVARASDRRTAKWGSLWVQNWEVAIFVSVRVDGLSASGGWLPWGSLSVHHLVPFAHVALNLKSVRKWLDNVAMLEFTSCFQNFFDLFLSWLHLLLSLKKCLLIEQASAFFLGFA